ncbi:11303_t:CDS:1, partial [Racocetra fulgida]
MDELLQERLAKIKKIRGSDKFDSAFELLKEIVQELFNNYDKVLKNKNEKI